MKRLALAALLLARASAEAGRQDHLRHRREQACAVALLVFVGVAVFGAAVALVWP